MRAGFIVVADRYIYTLMARDMVRGMDETWLKNLYGVALEPDAVLRPHTLLEGRSFVGAGAVVTRDVKDYALVVGNPARQIGWMCECGERLRVADGTGTCARCGKSYAERGGALEQT